jgi:hypothetical protein
MKRIARRLQYYGGRILMYWFFIKVKFSRKIGVSGEAKGKLIVSLTTYPARWNIVYVTIESLMRQTIKPDSIVLWLSAEEAQYDNIPDNLKRLESRGLDIRFVDENLKSYKKLIYSLDCYLGCNIITCDDDVLYPKDFISGLVKASMMNPGCIVAYRCTVMSKIDNKALTPYLTWPNAGSPGPSLTLFPTGNGGILYPPGSLHSEVLNKKAFIDLCPLADDVWFKAMALINETKVVMVNDSSIEFPTVNGTQDSALWHENVIKNRNDEQLKKVFDFYKLYDYIG